MTKENTAIIPVPKLENDFYDWYKRHDDKTQLARNNQFDIIFIGDSITHLFEGDPNLPGRGENVWKELLKDKKVLNLGFGWDRTQNVLWRLQNGEFTNQKPKLVVLKIGTNNLTGTENARTNTPAEIAQGIEAICDFIHEQSPTTNILLLGVLPRGEKDSPLRIKITEINTIIAEFAEKPFIQFLDIGNQFLQEDGSISTDIMSDLVHPTKEGYQIWANAIQSILDS